MLEDVRPAAVDAFGEPRQVLARMEPGLTLEHDPRPSDERHRVEVCRFESPFGRQGGFFLQTRTRLRGIGVERGELVARHPRPPAIDAFGGHDGVDLDHGGQTRVPQRPRVIAPEVLDEVREVGIGHAGDVGSRVSRVHASAAPAIDDGDRTARALQQVGRGQAGNPGADHRDVDRDVPAERRVARHGRRVFPVGRAVKLSHLSASSVAAPVVSGFSRTLIPVSSFSRTLIPVSALAGP